MGNSERMMVSDRGRGGFWKRRAKSFGTILGKFDKLSEMGEHRLDGWRREETQNDADRGDEMEGLFTKEWITFRKSFRNGIRNLSWFESLTLPFVNATLFQIRLLNSKKRAFWIMICLESLIMRTCERKALSECDSCVRISGNACWNPCKGQSAQ